MGELGVDMCGLVGREGVMVGVGLIWMEGLGLGMGGVGNDTISAIYNVMKPPKSCVHSFPVRHTTTLQHVPR